MSCQRSFILLKPDAIIRGLLGEIISAFERKGFKIVAMKLLRLTDEQFYNLYPEIAGKPFHEQFKSLMFMGPCVAMAVEGHEAVRQAYQVAGMERDPELELSCSSIRGRFCMWTGSDLIHRADTMQDAENQIALFFEETDFQNYKKLDELFMSEEGWNAYCA